MHEWIWMGCILLPCDHVCSWTDRRLRIESLCSQVLALRLKVGQGFDESVNFPTWQITEDHLLARRHLFIEDLPLEPHRLGSIVSMGEGRRCHVLLKDLWRLWHSATPLNSFPCDHLVLGRDASPYSSLQRSAWKIIRMPHKLSSITVRPIHIFC